MRLYILNLGLLFSFTAWANGDQIKEAPANLLDQDKLDQENGLVKLDLDDIGEHELNVKVSQDVAVGEREELAVPELIDGSENLDLDDIGEHEPDVMVSHDVADYDEKPNLMPDSLNTIGVDDSGNWVQKRVSWEKAEQEFGKAMALVAQVIQQQLVYFSARNEIDKQLDAGKCALSLNMADLTKTVSHLLNMTEILDINIGKLDNSQKNSFRANILENKDHLLALKADLDRLIQLDVDMDNVIIKVIDQVQKCSEYEAKAWEGFKQIGRVLSDDTAKTLYYQVANYRKNIKLVLNYLKIDLKLAFDGLIESSKLKLTDVSKNITVLHDNGIDLAYEFKALNEGPILLDQQMESAQTKTEPKKLPKAPGMWGTVMHIFKTLWDIVLWLPRKMLGLLGIKI